jgi:hypothetical protein
MKIEIFESEIESIKSNLELGKYVRSKMLVAKAINSEDFFIDNFMDLVKDNNAFDEEVSIENILPEEENEVQILDNLSVSASLPMEWVSSATGNIKIKY